MCNNNNKFIESDIGIVRRCSSKPEGEQPNHKQHACIGVHS